jgi:hypothetical protein
MIFLLIDSKIEKYDLLIIQKSWRNVCVSTSYNSFNVDFYLLYKKSKNVRTCFYINFKLKKNHWSIIFASEDVCFFRIQTANDRWINVHNVYNVLFNSYTSISTLLVIQTIKRQLNDEKNHIILKKFNLHLFFRKLSREINVTRRNKSVFKRCSSNSISFHAFVEYNHVKNAQFM